MYSNPNNATKSILLLNFAINCSNTSSKSCYEVKAMKIFMFIAPIIAYRPKIKDFFVKKNTQKTANFHRIYINLINISSI